MSITTITNQELTIKLAEHGLMGQDAVDTANKIVAAIPEATAATYANMTEEEKAVQFFETYMASQSGAPTTATDPTGVTTATTPSNEIASKAELNHIKSVLNKDRVKKEQIAAATSIKKLLIDREDAMPYIPKDAKITVSVTPEKLAEYEAALVDDEENKKAFYALKAAVESKQPLEIYRGKPANKVIGMLVSKPDGTDTNAAKKDVDMTVQEMMIFLATQVNGILPCVGDGIGAKITWAKPNAKSKVGSKNFAGSPRLAIGNKAIALKDKTKHEYTAVVKKDGKGKVDTQKGKLSTELSFKVKTDRLKADQTPITRTVRFKGEYAVPLFERKDAYVNKFGSADNRTGVFGVPNTEQAAKIRDNAAKTVAWWQQFGDAAINLSEFTSEPAPEADVAL